MAPNQIENPAPATCAAGPREDYKKHAISLLVNNKPGVLIRIALVFAKRAYNIESLVVSPAREIAYSRMIITASGDSKTLEQILKQLNKLVDVISAKDHTGEVIVERELGIMKVCGTAQQRTEILQIAHAFECKVVDLTDNAILLQLSGEPYLLDSLEKMMNNYEVIEFIRTGKVIVSRGDEIT
jgi:acetolactate synthase I/III small subunit